MSRVSTEELLETGFLTSERKLVSTRPIYFRFRKRLFDIIASALGLVLLAPLFLFVAVLIKRDSPGKAFYEAERMGRFGKPFRMLKFRTMYEQPVGSAGAPLTKSEDPRITKVGRWLRDAKLNELPQLVNVLRGEMSLVGPRPEDVNIALNWPEEARTEILSVRPGITSPASVIYRDEEKLLKGDGFLDEYLGTILPDKLRLDQLYVRNLSLLTELDVLAMTFVALIPTIRRKTIDERWLIAGPLFRFFTGAMSWFLIDTLVAAISVGLAGLIWRLSAVINIGVLNFALITLSIAMLFSLITLIMGLNRVQWPKASPVFVIDLAFSAFLTMVVIWVINRNWLTQPRFPFSMLALMGLMIFIGVVLVRYRERLVTGLANRWLLVRGAKASFAERILVVGAGNLGEMTVWLLSRSAFATVFGLVGMVDDDPHKRGSQIMGLNVIGTTRDIPALAKKYEVGVIFFAIERIPERQRQALLTVCESTGARTVQMPDLVRVLDQSIKQTLKAERHEP